MRSKFNNLLAFKRSPVTPGKVHHPRLWIYHIRVVQDLDDQNRTIARASLQLRPSTPNNQNPTIEWQRSEVLFDPVVCAGWLRCNPPPPQARYLDVSDKEEVMALIYRYHPRDERNASSCQRCGVFQCSVMELLSYSITLHTGAACSMKMSICPMREAS